MRHLNAALEGQLTPEQRQAIDEEILRLRADLAASRRWWWILGARLPGR
jgi:hypothetical protein